MPTRVLGSNRAGGHVTARKRDGASGLALGGTSGPLRTFRSCSGWRKEDLSRVLCRMGEAGSRGMGLGEFGVAKDQRSLQKARELGWTECQGFVILGLDHRRCGHRGSGLQRVGLGRCLRKRGQRLLLKATAGSRWSSEVVRESDLDRTGLVRVELGQGELVRSDLSLDGLT